MNKDEQLEVTIKYKDFKQTIIGSPENVTNEYLTALSKVIPTFRAISGLTFEPNLTDMAAKLIGYARIYRDRVYVLEKNTPVEDATLLALTIKYVGSGLRLISNDSMSVQEILSATGKNKKSLLRVLEKLKSSNAIEQLLDGKYRISDWKAYDYVLRKGSSRQGLKKLTDFADAENVNRFPVYTVGYEGKEPQDFLKAIKTSGIEILVDVRKDAYSKQDQSFSEGTLCRILTNAKIKYIHLPELGVDLNLREELRRTHDYDTYFRRYSEYLDANNDLIAFLDSVARKNVICLMCYERDFRLCHRSIIASKLEQNGAMFHHL